MIDVIKKSKVLKNFTAIFFRLPKRRNPFIPKRCCNAFQYILKKDLVFAFFFCSSALRDHLPNLPVLHTNKQSAFCCYTDITTSNNSELLPYVVCPKNSIIGEAQTCLFIVDFEVIVFLLADMKTVK